MTSFELPQGWHHPPAEYSLVPFWFWNDDLSQEEIVRQMADFQAHGVDAFVIHPRAGLPRRLGWMSRPLLDMMRFAIEEAQKRAMWVILYDEGMYPSGSSSGQVVEENPAYQCRGLVRINLAKVHPDSITHGIRIDDKGRLALSPEQHLVAHVNTQGHHIAIVDRPVDAVIRGLHYIHDSAPEPPEDTPPAADLLNPDAVACFIRLVYDRFYEEFGDHFGRTIRAIFTDEPNLLGRLRETEIIPGTTGILEYVNDFLGYDFTSYLPELWNSDDASDHHRREYQRALMHRLHQTYYQQLYNWCEFHGIALTGHPAEPDATLHLRCMHIPGQDIVWRQIEPDKPSALEGRQSTQAKATSSMMVHTGRRRNANEFCGAYGLKFTFDEMRWLANWLLIRGCNLLIPHAFYYSVRGPRLTERPPDVGPHSTWWDTQFTDFAHACRRLCWLNTDSEHICQVAILGGHHQLPWRAAKACFQHQIDFNYLDVDDLAQTTATQDNTLVIAQAAYRVLIVDGALSPTVLDRLDDLTNQISIVYWTDDTAACLNRLVSLLPPPVLPTTLARGLRVRHVRKHGLEWYVLFNEEQAPIDSSLDWSGAYLLDPYSNTMTPFAGRLSLAGHELCVLVRKADGAGMKQPRKVRLRNTDGTSPVNIAAPL